MHEVNCVRNAIQIKSMAGAFTKIARVNAYTVSGLVRTNAVVILTTTAMNAMAEEELKYVMNGMTTQYFEIGLWRMGMTLMLHEGVALSIVLM